MQFVQSNSDHCLYTKDVSGDRIYILEYVDDILAGSEKEAHTGEIYY